MLTSLSSEKKTAALGEQLAALAKKAGDLGEKDKALAQRMSTELSEFTKQMASIRDELSKVSKKLASLKSAPALSGEKIALQALFLGQLEAEILAGRPYREPLDRLRKSLSGAESIQLLNGLDGNADRGIPTGEVLTKRFGVLLQAMALRPRETNVQTGEKDNFQSWFMAKLKSIVSIRRVSGPGPLPPLSKAEAAVGDGDFAAAAQELEQTKFAGAAPWIADARAYAQSRKAITRLRGHVSAILRNAATRKPASVK